MRYSARIAACILAVGLPLDTACSEPFIVPSDVFFEYGHVSSDSQNSALDSSYVDTRSEILGADFTLPRGFRTGLRLFLAASEATGGDAFGNPGSSGKDQRGISGYVSNFVLPFLEVGVASRYVYGTGDSVFTNAVAVRTLFSRERGSQWAIAPYFTVYVPLRTDLFLSLTSQAEYVHSQFWYEPPPGILDMPSSATTWSWTLHDMLMLRYFATTRLQLFTWATLHDTLGRRNFANVQANVSDWLTAGIGASYRVWDGIELYARGFRNFGDEHFVVVGASGGVVYRF